MSMTDESVWTVAPMLGFGNVREAARYYIDTLGFAFAEGAGVFAGVGDEEEGGVYAIVWRSGASIHLQIRRGDRPRPERESHEGDAYLFVDDANALFEEYQAKGVTILRPPEDEPYGLRDFTIEDPFGHRLTFGTPLGA
jgi:uncharacterized glyoxalase superfamily protein PhnB